jgi:parallel beta-helix repeat protein
VSLASKFSGLVNEERLKHLTLALLLALLLGSGPMEGVVPAAPRVGISKHSCTRFAAPTGRDASAGTFSQPFRTVQKLVDSLGPGQAGCLRRGTYRQPQVTISSPGIRLTSYRGERGTVVGRLRVAADGVTVDRLNLNGRNPRDLPSPTINADNADFRDDNVSNPGTSSCFLLGGITHVRSSLIERNRIHNCGVSSTYDHGIYMSDVDGAEVVGNTIYDNASRGIKVGPNSQGALIEGNVIDGNPTGLSFSGDDTSASSGNFVVHNVISNSTRWWNVQSYWSGSEGSGNVLRNNCVHGGNPDAYYNQRGGVSNDSGFTTDGNLVAAPEYFNRGAKDFRLRSDSACWRVYRPTP